MRWYNLIKIDLKAILMNLESCLTTIRNAYPDITLNQVRAVEDGQFNYVVIADEQYVFRFPRYENGRQQLQAEVAMLKALQNRLPVAVPNPTYTHLDAPIGEAFIGYTMLHGSLLDVYAIESIFDDATSEKLAQQLAGFLKELHSIPLDTIPAELSQPPHRDHWVDMYQRIQTKLFDRMHSDARTAVTQHFESYLNEPEKFEYIPCLIHGDFGYGNILFDEQTKSVCAVLDLEAIQGDPAIDLAALYGFNGRGQVFAKRIARYYPEMEAMMPRILFYSGTYALEEALHGIENGDDEALEAGLEPYI
jgi:aminoglycoside 2''-phosphotransferase